MRRYINSKLIIFLLILIPILLVGAQSNVKIVDSESVRVIQENITNVGLNSSSANDTYLLLDTSNDPLTGTLDIEQGGLAVNGTLDFTNVQDNVTLFDNHVVADGADAPRLYLTRNASEGFSWGGIYVNQNEHLAYFSKNAMIFYANSYFYVDSAGAIYLDLGAAGTYYLRNSAASPLMSVRGSTGNTGIGTGTSIVNDKLAVVGNVNFTGNLTVGSNLDMTDGNITNISRIAIGKTDPQEMIDAESSDSDVDLLTCSNTDQSTIHFKKARGTCDNPTATQDGDSLGYINAMAYNGSEYITTGYMRFRLNSSEVNSTSLPTEIIWGTTPNSSLTPAVREILTPEGYHGFGTLFPTHTVEVLGSLGLGGVSDNIEPFSGSKVDDASNGYILRLYRWADEGNDYTQWYINQNQVSTFDGGTVSFKLNSPAGKYIYLDSGQHIYMDVGTNSDFFWRDVNTKYLMNLDGNTGNLAIGKSLVAGSEKLEVNGSMMFTEDDQKLYLGAAKDSSINYNGSAMILDSQEVGAGNILLNPNGGNVGFGSVSPDSLAELVNGDLVLREDDDGEDAVKLSATNWAGHISIYSLGARTVLIGGSGDTYFDTGDNFGIGTQTPQQTLNVVGDVNVTNNFTGNQIYGEMSYYNSTATSINFAAANVNYTLWFTESDLNGFTFTGGFESSSNLTVQVGGKYKVNYHAVGDGQNNHIYVTSVFIDSTRQDKCTTIKKMSAGGDIVTMAGTCFIDLVAGDDVSLRVMDNGGTGAGNYYGANINLIRIGD